MGEIVLICSVRHGRYQSACINSEVDRNSLLGPLVERHNLYVTPNVIVQITVLDWVLFLSASDRILSFRSMRRGSRRRGSLLFSAANFLEMVQLVAP